MKAICIVSSTSVNMAAIVCKHAIHSLAKASNWEVCYGAMGASNTSVRTSSIGSCGYFMFKKILSARLTTIPWLLGVLSQHRLLPKFIY